MLVVLPLMMALIMSGEANYCRLSKQHTMCLTKVRCSSNFKHNPIFLDQGRGQSCDGTVVSRGIREEEKAEIVDIHNR